MRIGLFLDSYSSPSPTLEFVDLIKKHYIKEGHDVYIFAPGTKEQRESNNDDNVFLFTSAAFKEYPDFKIPVFPFISVSNIAKNLSLDVVHSFAIGTMGVAAFNVSHKLGIPSIATAVRLPYELMRTYFDSNPFSGVISDLAVKYVKWLYSHFNKVVAPSNFASSKLSNIGVNVDITIPTAIDVKYFSKKENKRRDKHYAVFTGTIVREKNLNALVDVLPSVFNKLPDLKFEIIGSGPDVPSVVERLNSLLLSDRVHVVVGFMQKKKLRELFAKASLFLYPPAVEPFSTDPFKALLQGCVPIFPKSSSVSDFIKNEDIMYDNVKDLPQVVERVLSFSSSQRRRLINSILPYVNDLDVSNVGDKYIELYESLMKK